jgi:hypothetical protein
LRVGKNREDEEDIMVASLPTLRTASSLMKMEWKSGRGDVVH